MSKEIYKIYYDVEKDLLLIYIGKCKIFSNFKKYQFEKNSFMSTTRSNEFVYIGML